SLIVTDWAAGQRPKRGRGRVYRITAPGQPQRQRPVGDGIEGEIARLDAESYAERCEGQGRLERRGAEGLAAVRQAIRQSRIGARGRLHAVWILARPGGPAAIDELVELARSDPDPRGQAQAVRAGAGPAGPGRSRP